MKGIGTDLLKVSRIENAVMKHGNRFARRILCDSEFQQYEQHHAPMRYLAKAFAAKEAVSKALGTGIAQGVSWQNIEILRDTLGKPGVVLSGGALSRLSSLGAQQVMLSLSDEHDYILAFSVIA